MYSRRLFMAAAMLGCVLLYFAGAQEPPPASPTEGQLAQLGKLMFFDQNLSVNGTQSCATCHAPEVGFTGPDSVVNAGDCCLSRGPGRPLRQPETARHRLMRGTVPVLHYDEAAGEWIGGMFWDGRATGWTLDDPLAEQAQGPFLNPLEQGMPGARQVVHTRRSFDLRRSLRGGLGARIA